MEPLISVIIPFYRSKEYIRVCIESVLRQTYTNLEIIAVNNNSDDGSAEILRRLQEDDGRIREVFCETKGVSAARNVGLAEAKGEWIAWLDSDDALTPDSLEILYHAALEAGASVALGGFYRTYTPEACLTQGSEDKTYVNAKPVVLREPEAIQRFFAGEGRGLTFSWAKLFRRDAYTGVVFPEGKIYEDIAVIPRLVQNVEGLVSVDRPVYYYVQHEDSTSRVPDMKRQMDGLFIRMENVRFYEENYPSIVPIAKDGVLDFVFYLLGCAYRCNTPKKDPIWKELKEISGRYAKKAAKQGLALKGGAFLTKLSPYRAGMLFAAYSRRKNRTK